MIRYKVKNCIDKDKDVILEIEEEFTNTLLNGLNISVTDFESDSLIINTTLSYVQVLDLYKMLTEKICSTQIQTLDIMKSKLNKCIIAKPLLTGINDKNMYRDMYFNNEIFFKRSTKLPRLKRVEAYIEEIKKVIED